MKINKFKKIALTIAGTSAAVLPFVSAACGGSKKFDVDTNTVKLSVTFSRNKQQWNALQWVLDAYNDIENRNKEFYEAHKDDFAKVELVHGGSGYPEGTKKIGLALQNKDQRSMPQLTLNYGGTISTAIDYQMNLNLGKSKDDDYGIDESAIDESFLKINKSISGAKEGEINYLPFLKSTINFGINGPVFKYILSSIKKAGVSVSADLESKFHLNDSQWEEDVKVVGDEFHFGAPIANANIVEIFKDFTIDGKILTQAEKLFSFVAKAQKCFTLSKDPETTSVHILGIDDFAGAWHYLAYSKAKWNDKLMPITNIIDRKTGDLTVSYQNAIKTSGDVYENLKPIFDSVMEAVRSGGLKLYGDGQYASSDQIFHKIGGNFGSTAGWRHNKIASYAAFDSFGLKLNDGKSTRIVNDFALQLINFGTPKGADYESLFSVEQKNTPEFKKEKNKSQPDRKYTYTNPILKTTQEDKQNNYSLILESSEFNSNYDEIANWLKATQNDPKKFLIKIEKSDKKLIEFIKQDVFKSGLKYLGAAKSKDGSQSFELFVTNFDVTKSEDISANIKVNLSGKSGQLNDGELIGAIAPTKWDETSKETSFLQGPNLMAFHSNVKINKATRLFVKWLYDSSKTFKIQKGDKAKFDASKPETYVETQVLKFFSKEAGYLIPFKGFEKQKFNDMFEKNNEYQATMFEQFKKVITDGKNVSLYEEPISPFADKYRNEVKSAFISLATTLTNDPSADISYKGSFITSIQTAVGTFK